MLHESAIGDNSALPLKENIDNCNIKQMCDKENWKDASDSNVHHHFQSLF